MITYTKMEWASQSPIYKVVHETRGWLGALYMDIDGYYVWDNLNRSGCLKSDILRNIADKLDELNKDWDIAVSIHSGF